MSVKSKKRIYVSVSPETEKALSSLATENSTPIATTAGRLLETALEIEEDKIWDEIASKREQASGKKYTHEEAWG